jgi:hypothetical protein
MIASRDSFPSEPRRACRRGVNHRFDFIERHDLICSMLGAQCPAGRFLNLLWFGRRITSGRVGRRNHWHPRQRRSWSFCKTLRTSRQVLILPYVVNDIFWGISCQQTGTRRAVTTIAKGSTERAKMRKICSSQGSSSRVQTYHHLPRMMPRQLSTNLDGSHVSSRSHRWHR